MTMTAGFPLFGWRPWMRIVWLCARPHHVVGARYPAPPYTGAPYEGLGIRCSVCGALATRSCTVPTRHHSDPPWAWPAGTLCGCGRCLGRARGRCVRALAALLGELYADS
ncbi:MAG: hypothetical protein KF764_08675 [Labilithrix sp.]|nr:hypothetical protein [Labilithrix sp.]